LTGKILLVGHSALGERGTDAEGEKVAVKIAIVKKAGPVPRLFCGLPSPAPEREDEDDAEDHGQVHVGHEEENLLVEGAFPAYAGFQQAADGSI
jgi:hypothetical protein